MQNLWKKIVNNAWLKIVSIVFACILWLVVVNVDNPQVTHTFKASVKVLNEEVITDSNSVYNVLDDTQIVSFAVTGPRSIIESLSSSDFTATADMNDIEWNVGLVPIVVKANKYETQLDIDTRSRNLKVSIEDLATQSFVVSVNTSGTPLSGFAEGDVMAQPTTVTISGPKSKVEKINKVTATINVEGAYSEQTATAMPVIYDENGEEVNEDNLTVTPSSISLKASILATKEVPIKVTTEGEVAEGYTMTGVEAVPDSIVIKGEKDVLNTVNAIEIPSGEMDVTGATKTLDKQVSITQYLPDNIALYDSDFASIAVTAVVEKLQTKTLLLPTADIMVRNLASEYQIVYNAENVSISVTGLSSDIENMTVDKISAYIDVEGLGAGNINVTATVTLPSNITLTEELKVEGEIQAIADEGSTDVDGTATGDDLGDNTGN